MTGLTWGGAAVVFGTVLTLVGVAIVATMVPQARAVAREAHMTGEQCVEHCKPLVVKTLDAKGCACMPGIEISLATQTCDRFCGGKPAKWLVSADMGFLCTCDYLPNVGVSPVPPPRKQ